jgi:hypothetical protein
MCLWEVTDNKIYPKWTAIDILLLLIWYEKESVNTSQMDIKRKTCHTRTRKNIYFSTYPPPTLIHLSHRFTSASKPAA